MLIPYGEFDLSYVRSSGPGGQNVNKVNSKCVLRWSPVMSSSITESVRARFLERFASRLTTEGELVLSSDRYRDQKRNFDDCVEKLQQMLEAVARPPKIRKPTKPSKGSQRRLKAAKKAHSEKKSARRARWD